MVIGNFFLIVLISIISPVLAMEEESYTHSTFHIEVKSHEAKHSSDLDTEHIAKAITYFLGSSSPNLQKNLSGLIRKRIRESQGLQQDIRSLPFDFDVTDLQSSDDQIQRYMDIKKLVGECVEEAIKVRESDSANLQVQLSIKEKDIALARKKLYAAVATSGLSLMGIVITFLTTYLSK